MRRIPRVLCCAVLVALAQGATPAEPGPDEMADAIRRQHEKNLELWKRHSWTSHAEVRLKGKPHTARTEKLSYGPGGEWQRQLVSETGPQEKSGASGLRQRAKLDKERRWMARLDAFLRTYTRLGSEPVLDAVRAARISGASTATARIRGSAVASPQDALTLWVDTASGAPRRLHVYTEFEGDGVTLEVEYARLDGGLVYPRTTRVRIPSRKFEIETDRRDFEVH